MSELNSHSIVPHPDQPGHALQKDVDGIGQWRQHGLHRFLCAAFTSRRRPYPIYVTQECLKSRLQNSEHAKLNSMAVVLKRFGSWATFVFQKPFSGQKNY